MIRRWLFPLATVLCVFASTAHAENRIAVRPFFGPHADDLRRDVVRILSRHRELSVVASHEVESSAQRLGLDASSPEGRLSLARKLRIAAWVEGIIQRHGKELRATVLVYDGREHDRIARYVVTRKKESQLSSALKAELWKKTRDALLSASAPPHEQPSESSAIASVRPENTEEASPSPESESSLSDAQPEESPQTTPAPAANTVSAASVPAPSMALGSASTIASARWNVSAAGAAATQDLPDALIASAEVGTLTRKLSYRDPTTVGLGDYSLPIAPQLNLGARYYPGAHNSGGWASRVGLDAAARLALAAKSKAADGTTYSSTVDAYGLGLRVRLPIRTHEVSFLAGYGIERFKFDDKGKRPAPTPDVSYRLVRLGAEGEMALTEKLSLGGRGAFLWLLAVGEIGNENWFPRLSGNGVEIGALAAYGLTKTLDLTFALGLLHYFFSFNVEAGDPRVAGGATDDYVTASLGLRLSL